MGDNSKEKEDILEKYVDEGSVNSLARHGQHTASKSPIITRLCQTAHSVSAAASANQTIKYRRMIS